MSRTDSFWFLAGALVTGAAVVMSHGRLWDRPPPLANEVIQNTPLAQSTQAASAPGTAGSLEEVTRKLAARLAAGGGSDNDWQLLAQSYEYMGRTAEAKAAKAHLGAAQPPGAGLQPVTPNQMAAVADALETPAAADSEHARITGTVEIVPSLAAHALAGATLFIYARQPNASGPPLAVLRVRADHWPVTFTLDDGNAMLPGRNLSNASNVQIEARISRSGDALPRPGDLVGSIMSVNPRDGHAVRISIDRQIG